jgi:large subunit ribosomal protein L25
MTVTLAIQPRTKEDKKDLAQAVELIPAVVYGAKFKATSISVNKKDFEKTFKTAGESTIIELQGLEAPVDVLVKEVSFSPIKGGITHVDFYVIEKGKEMTTNIPLHFIGEAPVEKSGAVLNKVLHEVEVTCKPKDLPAHLDVDLTKLVTAEDKITVADIVSPTGVKIELDLSDVVVLSEAVVERSEDEVIEEVNIADIEVEKKGKAEAETETETK